MIEAPPKKVGPSPEDDVHEFLSRLAAALDKLEESTNHVEQQRPI